MQINMPYFDVALKQEFYLDDIDVSKWIVENIGDFYKWNYSHSMNGICVYYVNENWRMVCEAYKFDPIKKDIFNKGAFYWGVKFSPIATEGERYKVDYNNFIDNGLSGYDPKKHKNNYIIRK